MTLLDNPVTATVPAPRAEPGDWRQPRERLAALFDPGTLREITLADSSGVLAGAGQIDGMTAVAFASDPGIQGGAMGAAGCAAIVAAYDQAVALGAPVIGLWHSGGARLREGVESLHGVGTVFAAMTRASGVVPQISVVLGPAAGGAAYGPALTDVVILSENGRIFVTGPDVVRSVTGEDVDAARLGGPDPHSRRSGVVHVVTPTDEEALDAARELALLLGRQGTMVPSRAQAADASGANLAGLLPDSARRAYDVHPVVDGLLDAMNHPPGETVSDPITITFFKKEACDKPTPQGYKCTFDVKVSSRNIGASMYNNIPFAQFYKDKDSGKWTMRPPF